MGVSEDFSRFCCNLRMSGETISNIQSRYKQITKRINIDFWDMNSDIQHSLYVGSYGRGTEIHVSDIDIIVQLPYKKYKQYNDYIGNGQSALLQEVKRSLQKTYGTSFIKADGQVIGINFTDGINFEIVPGFINTDGKSYTYPDTNNGGTWKTTYPRDEISAINDLNSITNKNLKRLCRMTRAWKDANSVPISGILIDTFAYKFLKDWMFNDKSYLYYDLMSRDFFEYLKDRSKEIEYWYAPGSNRRVYKKGNFQVKAKKAYDLCLNAIEYTNKGFEYSSKNTWREIYGSKFPSS
ncbi:TPA: nucleotidyltransferase [Enterococcus faecium]